MKTSSLLVLYALTLFNVIISSKISKERKRIQITGLDSSNTRPFPVHRLLMMNNEIEDDKEKDEGDNIVKDKTVKSRKRKAILKQEQEQEQDQVESETNFDDFGDLAVVNAFISMNKSSDDVFKFETEEEIRKPKKERIEKSEMASKPLLEITDKMLFNDTIKKYSKYFDESNMATVGCSTLFNCLSNSAGIKIATYLINNGAKLTDNEEMAIIALVAKEERIGLRTNMFKMLLEKDPLTITKIFIRAASMTESDDESVDMFFFGLLLEIIEKLLETKIDLIMNLIEILAESDRMINTLNLLLGDHERIVKLFSEALKNGNLSFVELCFELNLININEIISFSSGAKAQSVASALFGKIESEKIFNYLRLFNYDMQTSNDPDINPEGDILLSALAINDLKSFKKLLLLGASTNIRINEQSLEDFLRENEVEFFESIQSFKMGTLQVEEVDNVGYSDITLATPVSSSS